MKFLKQAIQKIAHTLGYHVLSKGHIAGDMDMCLKGLQKRGFNPAVIADLGAHKGYWSASTAKIYPKAQYYLFEPQAEMVPYINEFLQHHTARHIQAGIGASNSTLRLQIFDDYAGSSFLNNHQADSHNVRSVPVYSIDNLVTEGNIQVPDLCKIDIQGFELEALKGAQTILGKTEVFIIEVSTFEFSPGQPLAHQIIEYLAKYNYVLYDIAGFMNRPHDGAMGQIDLCFVLANSPLRKSNAW
jgi:FkbM family methyltransferase